MLLQLFIKSEKVVFIFVPVCIDMGTKWMC